MNIAVLKASAASLLILCASLPTADAQQTRDLRDSCKVFVQAFYDWYVPLTRNDKIWRAWDVAVRTKTPSIHASTHQLILRDTEVQRKASELVGLDFDPFLNSQDPGERFVVESVTAKGAGCWVKVNGISEGRLRETVVPEVSCKNGHCQFINFHYDDNGHPADLLTILKSPG